MVQSDRERCIVQMTFSLFMIYHLCIVKCMTKMIHIVRIKFNILFEKYNMLKELKKNDVVVSRILSKS